MADLTSVDLKIQRARAHLMDLDGQVGEYLDRQPYKIVLNTPPSDPLLMFIEFHVVTEPDIGLGLIVGDFLTNLRAALDHMTCRLVEHSGGVVTERTQFPIRDSTTTATGRQRTFAIDGISDPAMLDVFEAFQPYKVGTPTAHPLAVLRDLCNADKHRLLHVATAHLGGARAGIILDDGTEVAATNPPGRLVADQTPIVAIRLEAPFIRSEHPKTQVFAEGEAFVGLVDVGAASGRPASLVLKECLEYVEANVTPALRRLLT